MNKLSEKLLAFAIALTLIFSMAAPAFAANADNVKQYQSMTVFGDSIPCAYGYPSCKSFAPVPGSYPDVLSGMLGMDSYCSMAFCGCSLTTILYMLGIEVDLGDVSEMRDFVIREVGEGTWAMLDAIRQGRSASIGDIRDRIASSDLILINVGANDLCHIPFYMAKQKYNAMLSGGGGGKSAALLKAGSEFAGYIKMGFEYFMTAYPKIIEKLKSYNPQATIVLVGAYNPFINTCVFEGFEDFNSGKLISGAVALENAQLALWAKQYGCVYADVFDVSYGFRQQCITTNFDNSDGLATHPTLDGHKKMAELILKALPTSEKKLCVPQNTTARIELGGTDIGEYSIERGFLGWSLKSNESGDYLVPGDALTVTTGKKSPIWGYDGGFYCIGKVVRNTGFGLKYLSIQKRYLTADPGGTLSLVGYKVNADIYLKN